MIFINLYFIRKFKNGNPTGISNFLKKITKRSVSCHKFEKMGRDHSQRMERMYPSDYIKRKGD